MPKTLGLFLLAWYALGAAALPPVHGERLFRVEENGRVSFVLAAAHEVYPALTELAPIRAALRETCAVFLQDDLHRPDAARDLDSAGRDVALDLTPRQLKTLQVILGDRLETRWLHAQHLAVLIRDKFPETLMRARARFQGQLDQMGPYVRDVTLAGVTYDARLRAVVRRLYDGNVPPHYLLDRLPRTLAADPDHEQRTMGDLVLAEAQALGVPARRLPPPKYGSLTDLQLSMFDETNLRRMLDDAARFFDDDYQASLHMNTRLAYLISRELAKRFFTLPSAAYVELQDLLARSLVGHRVFFSGDEPLAEHEANMHRHWLTTLRRAVARGGAFIVLDVERVIPGADPRVGRTLLQALESDGARITPLAAERPTLRVINSR